jgi:uncharacterized membrane-anchored protein YitT (DUF2179 family)
MKKVYSFILINIGLIMVTAAIVIFKMPNNFVTGGATGIAIIIHKLFPSFSVGLTMLLINIGLLLIGFMFTGLEFEIKTIYSTIMLSLLVWFFEKTYPISKPITGDMMLELVAAIFLLAAGSAILFYQNASGGGTDIIAKLLNMKTHMHIGKTVLITDLIISVFSFSVFGVKIGIYSVIGVIIKGFLIDAVIQGLHSSKQIIIITSKANEIRQFILKNLNRGVTVYKAIGGNTNVEKEVLNTILNRRESIKLRSYIKQIDSKAFMTVSNVEEIIGKGFNNKEL